MPWQHHGVPQKLQHSTDKPPVCPIATQWEHHVVRQSSHAADGSPAMLHCSTALRPSSDRRRNMSCSSSWCIEHRCTTPAVAGPSQHRPPCSSSRAPCCFASANAGEDASLLAATTDATGSRCSTCGCCIASPSKADECCTEAPVFGSSAHVSGELSERLEMKKGNAVWEERRNECLTIKRKKREIRLAVGGLHGNVRAYRLT